MAKYEPNRDDRGWVSEDPREYALRIRSAMLPNWPDEVLIEWLHRHAGHIDYYAFLGFETFSFEKETWPLERIPGREAFDDESFCDGFVDIERRATNPHDWLAIYMLEKGTWNTPIVLLRNEAGRFAFPYGRPLKSPYHLLEGHRRLSFLNGLRSIGKASPSHEVWVVTKVEEAS